MVDVSESLPTLIRRPGLTHWVPTVSRDLQFFDSYEQYVASLPSGGKGTARLVRSHWPPTPTEKLCLERWWVFLSAEHLCLTTRDSIRIYPHLQDTGGFFVAVLQHKQPRALPKYRLTSPCQVVHTQYSLLQRRETLSAGLRRGARRKEGPP